MDQAQGEASEQACRPLCDATPHGPPAAGRSRAGAQTAGGEARCWHPVQRSVFCTLSTPQPAGLLFISVLYQETRGLKGRGRSPVSQSKSAVSWLQTHALCLLGPRWSPPRTREDASCFSRSKGLCEALGGSRPNTGCSVPICSTAKAEALPPAVALHGIPWPSWGLSKWPLVSSSHSLPCIQQNGLLFP